MSESVTSGLGRHGPWLQSRWIRVDSRLDDGSISPIGLESSFRPAERGMARVTLASGAALGFERCDYDVEPHEDALGSGRRLSLRSSQPRRSVVVRREIILYDALPFVLTRVGLTNTAQQPLKLSSLHAFTTGNSTRGRLQFASPPADWRMYRNGWQSWSPTMSLGGLDRDLQGRPPDIAPAPPLSEPGQFASDDVAVLFDPVADRSLLVGAVTARDFISQVVLDTARKAIDAQNITDGISFDPEATTWSEWFLIDIIGHPNDALARYGEALGRMMGARVPQRTPTGWCSWYYFYTTVTEADVVRNLRFLEAHRDELPVDTVQIDDGYQSDIGDWLTPNEKFPQGMQWLASEIKSSGYTPGLWLAPFLLSERARTYREHPEWVTRDSNGAPVVATNNWERANYGLDCTHPAARAWLQELFQQVCDGWGYDYVKIDFLFGGALPGSRHDPDTTRVRAYRAGLDAIRRGVGPDRFILGCGSLMAPSVGIFDGNRIGPDCAPFWRFLTRDERASPTLRPRRPDDGLSTETAMRNTINRSWMHNRLWANDPDCLLVRSDRTKMSLDEVRTMLSVIGLSGGMLLSSDDLLQLPQDRLDLLSMAIPPLPQGAVAPGLMEQDMPETFEVAYDRAYDPVRLAGLFNFSDMTKDVTLALPSGDWHVFELWDERYRGVCSGSVTFDLVNPHASRLVALRPATGRPQLIASTAHVGMGVLDVDDQASIDLDLSLRLSAVGRPLRRLYVTGGVPTSASWEGQAVEVRREGQASSVELRVTGPGNLVIRFAENHA